MGGGGAREVRCEVRGDTLAGKVEVRPMMYLALSYDHRMVDGKEAVTFLVRIKEAIEEAATASLESAKALPGNAFKVPLTRRAVRRALQLAAGLG